MMTAKNFPPPSTNHNHHNILVNQNSFMTKSKKPETSSKQHLNETATATMKMTTSTTTTWTPAGRGGGENDEELRRVLGDKVAAHRARVADFRQRHGTAVVRPGAAITVDTILGGMRSRDGGSLPLLLTETSSLHPDEGIRLRGLSIPECIRRLPKAPGGGRQPLPEAIWWLLLTGDVPTAEQVRSVSREWARRGATLPAHVVHLVEHLPPSLHPMSQLVSAIASLQSESKFAPACEHGEVPKRDLWLYAYEDAMDLLARLPAIASLIYKNSFRRHPRDLPNPTAVTTTPDETADWSSNFARMLGFGSDPGFVELLRLYLCIHSDHEGGNVSAHACHLVGSALSDPYLAFTAAMTGLAGPLHGRANQEVLDFLQRIIHELGEGWKDDERLRQWVLPGFGHAVLRVVDPRYTCQREFAAVHLEPNFPLYALVRRLNDLVPELLRKQGKARNPFPNMDAHSGVLLQYYGLTETSFYTVLFGVSRALGCMAQLVWDRALMAPIERPKSVTTDELVRLVGSQEQQQQDDGQLEKKGASQQMSQI